MKCEISEILLKNLIITVIFITIKKQLIEKIHIYTLPSFQTIFYFHSNAKFSTKSLL